MVDCPNCGDRWHPGPCLIDDQMKRTPLAVEDIKEAVRLLDAVEPPPGWPGPCSEFVPDADGGYQVDSCIYCGKPRREHATR